MMMLYRLLVLVLVLRPDYMALCLMADWPYEDAGADGVQPLLLEGTRHYGHPPPPGSSPVFVARTRNFENQRRADDFVVVDDDGQPPAVDKADADQ